MNKNNKWQSIATLYLTWFLVTAIGFTILVYLGDLIAERINYTSGAEFLGTIMIWIATFFICGGVWGFLQSRLMQLSAGHMISWVFVTAFNMVANRIIIYTVEEENLNLILTITVAGILGIIQFFILRKKTLEAVWWIPASILALAMSYVIGIQIHAYSERLLVIIVAAINGLVTGIPYVISFSKFKLGLVEKFTLVTFSAFLIASIWLPASAGLTAPDSTITTSDRTFEFEFSPDGKIVAMVDPDNYIHLRTANGWGIIELIVPPKNFDIRALSFSPDSQTIAVCCGDHTIELWDATSHRYIDPLRVPDDDYYIAVEFSPDNHLLALGGENKDDHAQLIIWDFNSRKILRIIDFSKQCDESLICSVGNLAFSPDGQTLAVSISLRWMEKNGNKIISLDPLSGEIIRQFDDFFKVSFNEDGDYFAAGSENEVKIIDVSTGKEIRSLSMGSDHFSFSLESDLLIEDSLNMLRVWDIENGVVVAKLGPLRYQGSYVISPDGKWVLSADNQCNSGRCTVNIWDMEKHLP